jgi:photosystem II stability/assembly factor-like uncharacterized protein
LFAGTDNGLYQRDALNNAWEKISSDYFPSYTSVYSLYIANDYLFAGVPGGGFLYSSNRGATWSKRNTGLTNSSILTIIYHNTDLFIGTSNSGVFRFPDNGSRWLLSSSGLGNLYARKIISNGTTLFAGVDPFSVYRSIDNGLTWLPPDSGLMNIPVGYFAIRGTNIYAGTYRYGVYVSTDTGRTWGRLSTEGLSDLAIYGLAVDDEYLYAGTEYSGVFRYSFEDEMWKEVNNGLTNKQVQSVLKHEYKLFAGMYGGGLFVSTNSGDSWSLAGSTSPTNTTIWDLASLKNNIFAATSKTGIFSSSDMGITWRSSNNGVDDTEITTLAVHEDYTFAGGLSGVYISQDAGTSWRTINDGLVDESRRKILTVQNSEIFLLMGSEIWCRPISEVVSVNDIESLIQQSFVLEQNYPNPFNSETIIPFSLPAQSAVTIIIYDALGREVSRLVHDELQSGNYSVSWNASGLPSGVYFYRLTAGTYDKTKKLLLVR